MAAVSMAAPLSAAKLQPCFHQVGGHMTKDQEPASYIDDEGRFYKPYSDGPRAERELIFYSALFSPPADGGLRRHVAYPSPDGQELPAGAASVAPRQEDADGLKPFVPIFYGTLEHEGHKLIALEDLCRPYKKPCVMDCKMGFTTVYAWADEKYRTKNAVKDAETTNAAVGFRVSGLQVYRAVQAEMYKPDRQWGKTLNKDNIGSAFQLFASGGHLGARELYGNPKHGALQQLRAFEEWAKQQRSLQFFQASVLIIYEGEASSMEEAAVRVAFVDFAHTYQTVGGARDENLVASLASLIAIIEAAAGL